MLENALKCLQFTDLYLEEKGDVIKLQESFSSEWYPVKKDFCKNFLTAYRSYYSKLDMHYAWLNVFPHTYLLWNLKPFRSSLTLIKTRGDLINSIESNCINPQVRDLQLTFWCCKVFFCELIMEYRVGRYGSPLQFMLGQYFSISAMIQCEIAVQRKRLLYIAWFHSFEQIVVV